MLYLHLKTLPCQVGCLRSRYSPVGTFKNENRPLASVVVLRTWDGYRSFDSVTVARGRGSPVPNLATTSSTDGVVLNCVSRPKMTAHSIIEFADKRVRRT